MAISFGAFSSLLESSSQALQQTKQKCTQVHFSTDKHSIFPYIFLKKIKSQTLSFQYSDSKMLQMGSWSPGATSGHRHITRNRGKVLICQYFFSLGISGIH